MIIIGAYNLVHLFSTQIVKSLYLFFIFSGEKILKNLIFNIKILNKYTNSNFR